VQRYSGNLNGREEVDLISLLNTFIFLVSRAYEKAGDILFTGHVEKRATCYLPDIAGLCISPGCAERLSEFLSDYKEDMETYCSGIAFIPQLEFDRDILNNPDIDSFYLVLFQKEMIPPEILKKMHVYFGQNGWPQDIEPFIVFDDAIAFSLRADRPYTCIKTIWTNPEFFTLSNACVTLDYRNCTGKKDIYPVSCNLLSRRFEETILKRASKIDSMLMNKTLYKMKTLELLRFFWASARTKLVALSLESKELDIPLTSGQVLERLKQLFPDESDWLDNLYKAYNNELCGRESEAFRYIAGALAIIGRI
jgi:hypothetical protein